MTRQAEEINCSQNSGDVVMGSATTSRVAVLRPLFAAATHEASAAMCRWTDGVISLTLDDICELPLDQVTAELGFSDDLLTMVVLGIESEPGTVLILTFDEDNARQLAATLTRRTRRTDPEWDELEISALTETGNILGCTYVNALTRLTGQILIPSPPYFLRDYFASVLEQALVEQAMSSDTALICRTGFHREGEHLNWHVLFIPSKSLRDKLERNVASGVSQHSRP
ncbi:MAG: chemotaxis protein [Thermogutta sp.]